MSYVKIHNIKPNKNKGQKLKIELKLICKFVNLSYNLIV